MNPDRKNGALFFVGIAALSIIGAGYYFFIAAPSWNAKVGEFIVPIGAPTDTTINTLKEKGYIKAMWALRITLRLRHAREIAPGGYEIAASMNVWHIASVLAAPPAMKWVVIPDGLRKEEIATILAKDLGWNMSEKERWILTDTTPDARDVEGVYFPDTYLMPRHDTTSDAAQRLRNRFNEKFAPYAAEAGTKNISWTTVVTLASLIQREAAGKDDMALISGILWNRLSVHMPLQIDATLQYAKGGEMNWWPALHGGDVSIDSPFNTYLHRGLPPHPIDNPGEQAIQAVLRPAKTDCLYYLHDASGAIHCATDFGEHRKNIKKYLMTG